MTDIITILKECGALLEGHFLLSSGRHSDRYFQCARLLQYPEKAAAALAPVADAVRAATAAGALRVDAVAGPAIGGILVAYELGRLLGLPAIFTERDGAGRMTLRRFELSPGMKILIAEDVVTTGKSSAECAAALEEQGGRITALSCLVDRRSGPIEGMPASLPPELPLFAAVKVATADWDAADCPLCKQGVPFIKPGSRPPPS
jgi:orotate phosphoribosyltransferase